MKLVKINREIFREYDIRGIYNTDLDYNVSYTIGRSFASYIKDSTVIIGHDNRESSPELHKALIEGLTESGANVIDLGLVTTPMYYFAKKHLNIKNGIMITASHNPREYNGFKISFSYTGSAFGKEISDFYDYTNKLNFITKEGTIKKYDIKEEYLNLIKNSINMGNRKVKAVVDCGNGTGSIIIKDILDMFNIEYELLYCDSDSKFPNHHPDPSVPENMVDLANKVKELGYDIGIGIDGDADRVGMVDDKGNVISGDLIILIIYRSIVNVMKKKKAIFDVKCSKTLIDGLKDLGLEILMYRTGSSILNNKVNGDDYDFGGEFAGHLWFRDRFMGFDDGIYAGLRLIEILSHNNLLSHELLNNTNKYYSTKEIKVSVMDKYKNNVVNDVLNYCKDMKYNYIDIDGVRAEFDDSWALIRASNTGPNLTVRFEANTIDRLNKIESEFMDKINEYINFYGE